MGSRSFPLAGLVLACAAASAGPPPPAAAPAPPPQVLIDPNDPHDANPPTPLAGQPDAELVVRGHRMYKDFCQKCHGVEMVSPGGGFFDLRTFPHDDKTRFVQSVTNGKRAMPPWGGVLKGDDIDSLWAYVRNGGIGGVGGGAR